MIGALMGALGGGGGGDPPPKPDGPAVQETATINLIENERNMTLLPSPVIEDPPWPMAAGAAGCFNLNNPGGAMIPMMLTQGMPCGTSAPDYLSRIHARAGQLLNSLNCGGGISGGLIGGTCAYPRTSREHARRVSNLASLVDHLRYGAPFHHRHHPAVHVHYHGPEAAQQSSQGNHQHQTLA